MNRASIPNTFSGEVTMRRTCAIVCGIAGLTMLRAAPDEVKPPSTETVPASTELVARMQAVEDGLAKLGETEATLSAIRADLAALRASVERAPAPAAPTDPESRRAQERIQARLVNLETVLNARDGSGGTALGYPRLSVILSGLAAALSLGAIISIVVLRSRGGSGGLGSVERRITEVRDLLAKAAPAKPAENGSARGESESLSALGLATTALRASAESTQRGAKSLEGVAERLEAATSALQPVLDGISGQVRDLETRRAALAADLERIEQSRTQESAARETQQRLVREADEQRAALEKREQEMKARLDRYEAIWPSAFHDGGALDACKARLLGDLAQGHEQAAGVMRAIVAWHALQRREGRDREAWIESAQAVGRAGLAYLERCPPPEAGEVALEELQAWTRAIKSPLEEAFPSLKLTAVYPGDRFDSDRMEAVSSISGGRLTVRQALSWLVLEKTADSTRILRRAEVITA